MTDWWAEIRYFTSAEFDSRDAPGSGVRMHDQFVRTLDAIRGHVGFPLLVNSGFRTPAQNRAVGGAANSAHLRGLAADIVAQSSATRCAIVEAALRHGIRRIGIGRTFVHLDMDPTLPQAVLWLY